MRWALTFRQKVVEVREWDNWYEYERTYWQPQNKKGVDRGEPSRATYAFHVLAGHHGILSLTPIWLLAIWGAGIWMFHEKMPLRAAAIGVALITIICVAFYIMRPEQDRNYGGVSCGFRWTFWLIPLWMFCMIPAADRLAQSRWGRALAAVLLAISVFSAFYASRNPWSHPWLFDYWTALGWINYQ
jgi:hypothetical protein